jgi:sigma-B regulation protein RsbU (phosphoserine phosphatase)
MKNPRALIVDDDAVNRAVLGKMLLLAGFTVQPASTAAEAICEARESVPDVILLDIEMPDQDGFWVCERLKESVVTADIPVIFISAREDVADKLRGFRLGAADFVTKPFRQEEVLARTRAHVRIRQLSSSLARANEELRARQEAIEEDLLAAAQIQKRLVPHEGTTLDGIDLGFFYAPSALIGGDIFNVLQLPDGRIAAYILDVSGHGVASALMTFAVSQALNGPSAMLRTCPGVSPATVVADLDRQFPLELFEKYFTLSLLLLDPQTGALEYTNAGHPPPFLLRAGGAALERLEIGGPALGMGFSPVFDSARLTLFPGDRLFLYTDGVSDQISGETRYGVDRLPEIITRRGPDGVRGLASLIHRDLVLFVDGAVWSDDLALCALEFHGLR